MPAMSRVEAIRVFLVLGGSILKGFFVFYIMKTRILNESKMVKGVLGFWGQK